MKTSENKTEVIVSVQTGKSLGKVLSNENIDFPADELSETITRRIESLSTSVHCSALTTH